MLSRIHVNQHVIKRNAREGADDPPITIKTYKGNTYAHTVRILGPAEVVYRPESPLSCGARLWIETQAEVIAE